MREWGQKDLADWDLPQRLRPGWDSEVIHSHVHDQGPLKLLPRISASLEDPRPSLTPHGSLGGHLVVTSDLSQKPTARPLWKPVHPAWQPSTAGT